MRHLRHTHALGCSHHTLFQRAVRWLVLWLALGWASYSGAVALPFDAQQVNLATHVEVLADPTHRLTLAHISSPAYTAQFQPWTGAGDVNVGFTESAYWLRVSLKKAPQDARNWVLEIPYAQISEIDFYAPGEAAVHTGIGAPVSSRPLFHRFFAFPMAPTASSQYFYIRVSSAYSLTVPLVAWEAQSFQAHVQGATLLQALYYGELLALMVYSLFLFGAMRDPRFFFYAVFAGFFGMGIFAGNGLGRLFLWPDQPQFDDVSQSVFLSLSGVFAVLFSRGFFQIKSTLPRLDRVIRLAALFFFGVAATLLSSLWWAAPLGYLFQLLMVTSLVTSALILVVSVHATRRGLGGASVFLLAWCLLWVGVVIASLRAYGWLPNNLFTSYSLQISSAAEMLLLSLALATMMRTEREARLNAQKLALDANRSLVDAFKASEERLEHLVLERTAQLQESLAKEHATLEQYTRFSSLISHEFRNPLAIIDNQLKLLQLELARGIDNLEKRLRAMAHATQRLTMLFNHWKNGEQLDDMLHSIQTKRIDLQAWLQHILESHIELQTSHRIESRLPTQRSFVHADMDLLEIALLNLLDNACKYTPSGSLILIEICDQPNMTGIAVIDEGPGIAVAQQTEIFSAYFRGAPEGGTSGMGLGLYLANKIVLAHHGHIDLQSAPGRGSHFCMWLPNGPIRGSIGLAQGNDGDK